MKLPAHLRPKNRPHCGRSASETRLRTQCGQLCSLKTGVMTSPLYPAFSFVLRRASKAPHSRSQGSGGAGPTLALKADTQAVHSFLTPQRPRCCPLPPKPHTAPHRRQGLAAALEALALDPGRFTPFHESLLYSLLRRNFCWSRPSRS